MSSSSSSSSCNNKENESKKRKLPVEFDKICYVDPLTSSSSSSSSVAVVKNQLTWPPSVSMIYNITEMRINFADPPATHCLMKNIILINGLPYPVCLVAQKKENSILIQLTSVLVTDIKGNRLPCTTYWSMEVPLISFSSGIINIFIDALHRVDIHYKLITCARAMHIMFDFNRKKLFVDFSPYFSDVDIPTPKTNTIDNDVDWSPFKLISLHLMNYIRIKSILSTISLFRRASDDTLIKIPLEISSIYSKETASCDMKINICSPTFPFDYKGVEIKPICFTFTYHGKLCCFRIPIEFKVKEKDTIKITKLINIKMYPDVNDVHGQDSRLDIYLYR